MSRHSFLSSDPTSLASVHDTLCSSKLEKAGMLLTMTCRMSHTACCSAGDWEGRIGSWASMLPALGSLLAAETTWSFVIKSEGGPVQCLQTLTPVGQSCVQQHLPPYKDLQVGVSRTNLRQRHTPCQAPTASTDGGDSNHFSHFSTVMEREGYMNDLDLTVSSIMHTKQQ